MTETLELNPPLHADFQSASLVDGQMVLRGQPNPEAVQLLSHERAAEEAGEIAIHSEVLAPPTVKVQEALQGKPPVDGRRLQSMFGLSEEQAEAAISSAEVMRPSARIAINMPRYGLEGMLKGGKYKSQWETGHGATGAIDTRNPAEERHGIKPQPGEEHLIYGYLSDASQERQGKIYGEVTSTYGTASVTLKPEVAERSTFTVGDSITPVGAQSGLIGFEDAVIAEQGRQIAAYSKSAKGGSYVEAQIQGGVRPEDIESISIDVGTSSQAGSPNAVKPHGEPYWTGFDAIEPLIQSMQESAPGVPLTVRIPENIDPDANGKISKRSLELAKQYPEVTFVTVLNSASPYKLEMARGGKTDNETINQDNQKIRDASRSIRAGASQQRDKYTEAIGRIWKEAGGEGDYPSNFKITFSNEVY